MTGHLVVTTALGVGTILAHFKIEDTGVWSSGTSCGAQRSWLRARCPSRRVLCFVSPFTQNRPSFLCVRSSQYPYSETPTVKADAAALHGQQGCPPAGA